MKQLQKVCRIVINGKTYFVLRDPAIEGKTLQGGFDQFLRRFILEETNGEWVACINFCLEFLSSNSWKSDEETLYGFGEMLEYSLANLLPHLPFDEKNAKLLFQNRSRACIFYNFQNQPDRLSEDRITYSIQLKESFFRTAQRIIFKNGVNRKAIRKEILQVLLNDFEENPTTFMRTENLQSSIPVTTKELLSNLYLLKEENKVDFITSPSDKNVIISVRIKAPGIRHLEEDEHIAVQSTHMVKNVFGTNIENTTYGSNSPITVNIDEIETVFEALQKDIKDNAVLDNKDEVLQTVMQLKAEIVKRDDPNKVKELLEKIKVSTDWIYKKIINNPILSSIIADLLMKSTGMK